MRLCCQDQANLYTFRFRRGLWFTTRHGRRRLVGSTSARYHLHPSAIRWPTRAVTLLFTTLGFSWVSAASRSRARLRGSNVTLSSEPKIQPTYNETPQLYSWPYSRVLRGYTYCCSRLDRKRRRVPRLPDQLVRADCEIGDVDLDSALEDLQWGVVASRPTSVHDPAAILWQAQEPISGVTLIILDARQGARPETGTDGPQTGVGV